MGKNENLDRAVSSRFLRGALAILLALTMLPVAALSSTSSAVAAEEGTESFCAATIGIDSPLVPKDDIIGGEPVDIDMQLPNLKGLAPNKIAISMTDPVAEGELFMTPRIYAGQEGVREDWEAIPSDDKFNPENFAIDVESDNEVVQVSVDRPNWDGGFPQLRCTAVNPGGCDVRIGYHYGRYTGRFEFRVFVTASDNDVVAASVPSSTLDVWAVMWGSNYECYFYDYTVPNEHFAHKDEWYPLRIKTQLGDPDNEFSYGPPTTQGFDDVFSITSSNPSVIDASGVQYDRDNDWFLGGDEVTYPIQIRPLKAGTSEITFALRSDPQKKAKVTVNVHTDMPQVRTKDYSMEVGSTQCIYIEGERGDVSAAPVVIDSLAQRLLSTGYGSAITPLIMSATSSNESIVKVQAISAPNGANRCAPYTFTALSAGEATISLVDKFGKSYSYKVNVTAVPGADAGTGDITNLTLDRDKLAFDTTMIDGEQLTATIASASNASYVPLWRSSDEKVATVDSTGRVKPLKAGSCIITAAAGGKAAFCNVTVEAASLCHAPADSALGEVAIRLPNTPPQAILDELKGLELSVSAITPGSNEALDSAAASLRNEGATVYGAFDIHFNNKADGTEHPWNRPDFPLTLRVPLNDEMRSLYSHGQLVFYHVNDATGERERMRTWVEGDFVCFETTHFSPYVLVREDVPQQENNGSANENGSGPLGGSSGNGSETTGGDAGAGSALPGTGDGLGTTMLSLLACLMASAGVAAVVYRKKLVALLSSDDE